MEDTNTNIDNTNMEISAQTQPSFSSESSSTGKGGNSKALIWTIVAIIILAGLYFYFQTGQEGNKEQINKQDNTPAQTVPNAATSPVSDNTTPFATTTVDKDTTTEINNDLQNIDTSGIDSDLKDIDQQLNNL